MYNKFPLLFAVFFIAACAPEKDLTQYSRQDLHHDLWSAGIENTVQKFTVSTSTAVTIIGKKGTKIIIPPDAFVFIDDTGKTVSSPVEIRFTEVYQVPGMLENNLATVDEAGNILESAGMLFLSAFSGEKELKLKSGKEILTGFPKRKGFINEGLFYGKNAQDSVTVWEKDGTGDFNLQDAILATYFNGDTTINLKVILDEKEARRNDSIYQAQVGEENYRLIYPGRDTIALESRYPQVLIEDESFSDRLDLTTNFDDYYYFQVKNLGWINCDRFVDGLKTDLELNVGGFPNNTHYYLVFEDISSVMYGFPASNQQGDVQKIFTRIPVDYDAKLVIVYKKEEQFYFASKDFVVEPQLKIGIKPEITKEEDIRNFLNSLGQQQD